MKAALARHDQIIRDAAASHGGRVFKTVGDAFCIAFAAAPHALRSALDAQRALHTEDWGEVGAIRVRMALHTGTAELRNGDYFGPALNRIARLDAVGHGGQILLSRVTQDLVRDELPEGVSLLDLGEHRLKDLLRPERIFQIVVPDLTSEFPPLRTLDVHLTNLPAQATPFIGREHELAAVLALLRRDDVRLITLSGTGGTGKSRLALQTAANLLEEFEHGVYFVDLAPITDPELMLSTVARVLAVKEIGNRELADRLKDHLREKHMLLVLDNFEQVIKAAPLVSDLLTSAPRLKIIVTSREVLRVHGEHDYSVPPLGLPERKRRRTIAILCQYESVALFMQRAKASRSDFEITKHNAPAIAEICIKLDGLPLAIELAAARVRLLTPQSLLERLSSRLGTLGSGARGLAARQRTLRGAIDWSYNLLDEGEKKLFARLGVFVGGWTLEAAEEVCGDDLPFDVLDGLESLLDKSLLRVVEGRGQQTRFLMLETIREYAVERLDQSEEGEVVRDSHARYFLALTEQEKAGAAASEYLESIQADHDNVRAALGGSLEGGKAEVALRMGYGLWTFWYLHGHLSEGRRWLEEALVTGAGAPAPLRANALRAAGNMAYHIGDYSAALVHQEECLELYRQLGDKKGIAASLNNLAITAADDGDFALSRSLYEDSLALSRELGDRESEALTLGNLGNLELYQGQLDEARSRYQQSLEIYRGQSAKAGIPYPLSELGDLARRQGDCASARTYLTEAITISRDLGIDMGVTSCVKRFGDIAVEEGRIDRALRLFGAAEALREGMGLLLQPFEHTEYEHTLEALRGQLDEEVFNALMEEGRAMTRDEAVEYVLEGEENG
jgi:predicted ATPase